MRIVRALARGFSPLLANSNGVLSPAARAFAIDARAYRQSRDPERACRLIASPLSGVPQYLGAAYAELARRGEDIFDATARRRIAAGGAGRDALLAFQNRLQRLAAGEAVEDVFALPSAAEDAQETAPMVLRDPVSPEPGAGMRTRLPYFSASALNTYVECARKWYYRYLCAAVEDKGSSASFYGTAFHGALEAFHGEFPQPSEAAPETMRLHIEGYVNAAFERYRSRFETAVEYELQRRRAQRTAQRYMNHLVEQAQKAPFTVIGCELEARLNLDGYDFIGYIDRLDRDDRSGNVAIVDYKTGVIATSAAEWRDKVRRFADFQLPFYYWARTASGDRVTRLALVPLKDALLDVRPISLEVVPVAGDALPRDRRATGVIGVVDLERARTRMVEICRELSEGAIAAFAATSDPAACTYCAYAVACRQRPAPAFEKFAR